MDDVVGNLGPPKYFSFHREGGGVGGPGIEEIDVETLAVAGKGTGCMGALFVQPHETTLMYLGRPEELARGAVQAKNALGLLVFVGGRQNYLLSKDDGGAVPAPGNLRFPKDVLRIAPFKGQVLSRGGHAVLPRAAPKGPISRCCFLVVRTRSKGSKKAGQKDEAREFEVHEGKPQMVGWEIKLERNESWCVQLVLC